MKTQNNTFRHQDYLTNIEHRICSESINLLSKIFPNEEHIVKGFKSSLLTHGINGKYKGWSLLHLCAYRYDELQYCWKAWLADPEEFPALKKLINLLIDGNADVNIQDDLGRTPIYFTSNKDMMKILLEKGANLSHSNDNVTALHVLSYNVYTYVIDHIMHGADPYAVDKFGRLPLHVAAANHYTSDDPKNIKALIDHAPLSVVAKDKFGHYPLFYALIFGSAYAVDILLEETPHSIIEEVIVSIENNTFNEHQLSERLELDNAIYQPAFEFKMMFGAGKKPRKPTIAEVRQIAENKQERETFTHEGNVYYLHPDDHGIKHTKLSKRMTSDSNNKKITKKDFIAKYKNEPATFNEKYVKNYKEKLSEIIKSAVLSKELENKITVFDMKEVVGWDRGEPTKFIELYYNDKIGSHMRPKTKD